MFCVWVESESAIGKPKRKARPLFLSFFRVSSETTTTGSVGGVVSMPPTTTMMRATKDFEEDASEAQPLISAASSGTPTTISQSGASSSSSSLKRAVGVVAIAGATACVAGTMMGGRISGGVGGVQRPWLGSVDGYPTETYSNPAQFDHSVAGKKEGDDFPIFLHIPKSGGTSVESMVGVVGGKLGSCNSEDLGFTRPFEIHPAWVVGKSEDFHSPPKERHLANSFVTVRNPYARAESEFAWFKARYFHDDPLDEGYSERNCEEFSNWIHKVTRWVLNSPLLECYREGEYTDHAMAECDATIPPTEEEVNACVAEKTAGDMVWKEAFPICSDMLGAVTWHHSHHTPAYVIARHAEHVFPLETCMTSDLDQKCEDPRTGNMQDNLVKFLKEKISDKIEYKEMNVVHRGTEVGESVKPVVTKCWTNGHISDDDLNNFKAAYAIDFQKYGYSVDVQADGYEQAPQVGLAEKENVVHRRIPSSSSRRSSSSSSSKSSSSRRGQSTTRKLLSINDWTSKLFGSDTTTKVSEVVPSETARTGKAQHGSRKTVRVSDFAPHLGTDEGWPVVENFGHDSQLLEYYPACPPPHWDETAAKTGGLHADSNVVTY